jgi:hypothetical protein
VTFGPAGNDRGGHDERVMHDGWHHDGWGPGAWIAMGLMMLAFLRILDERFARGEIDSDEYTRRRELLRSR